MFSSCFILASLLLLQPSQDDRERARALVAERRFQEALDVLDRLPPDAEIHLLSARALRGIGETSASWKRYRLALPDYLADRDVVYEAAAMAARAGEFDASLALAEIVLGPHPGDHEMRVLRATVLSWEGRFSDAERECLTVLDTASNFVPARVRLGYVRLAQGRTDDSRDQFLLALVSDPWDREARRGLAAALNRGGRRAEAEAICRELLAQERDTETLLELARIVRHSSRREAESLYTEYLRRQPRDEDARRELMGVIDADAWVGRTCMLIASERDHDKSLGRDADELRTLAWRTSASRYLLPTLQGEAILVVDRDTLRNLVAGGDNYDYAAERLTVGAGYTFDDERSTVGARAGVEHFGDLGSGAFQFGNRVLFAPVALRGSHAFGAQRLSLAWSRESIIAQVPIPDRLEIFHHDQVALIGGTDLAPGISAEAELDAGVYSRQNTELALRLRGSWRANDWLTLRPSLSYRDFKDDVPFYFAFDNQVSVALEAEARRRWGAWVASAAYQPGFALTHEEVNPDTFIGLPSGVVQKTTTNIASHRLRLTAAYSPTPRFSAGADVRLTVNSNQDLAWSVEACVDVRF